MLIVLSGPSGVGKTTLVNELLGRDDELVESVSATTRPKRKGEKEGRDYFFLSADEFERKRAADGFAEHARVFGGHCYGTPREFLESALAGGRDVIMDIDVQGTAQLMERYRADGVFVFVEPVDTSVLLDRLSNRSTESREERNERLRIAEKELGHAAGFDHRVVNNKLDEAIEQLATIIRAEREKRKRQK